MPRTEPKAFCMQCTWSFTKLWPSLYRILRIPVRIAVERAFLQRALCLARVRKANNVETLLLQWQCFLQSLCLQKSYKLILWMAWEINVRRLLRSVDQDAAKGTRAWGSKNVGNLLFLFVAPLESEQHMGCSVWSWWLGWNRGQRLPVRIDKPTHLKGPLAWFNKMQFYIFIFHLRKWRKTTLISACRLTNSASLLVRRQQATLIR